MPGLSQFATSSATSPATPSIVPQEPRSPAMPLPMPLRVIEPLRISVSPRVSSSLSWTVFGPENAPPARPLDRLDRDLQRRRSAGCTDLGQQSQLLQALRGAALDLGADVTFLDQLLVAGDRGRVADRLQRDCFRCGVGKRAQREGEEGGEAESFHGFFLFCRRASALARPVRILVARDCHESGR